MDGNVRVIEHSKEYNGIKHHIINLFSTNSPPFNKKLSFFSCIRNLFHTQAEINATVQYHIFDFLTYLSDGTDPIKLL